MVSIAQADILENTKTGARFVVVAIVLPSIILYPLNATRFDLVAYPSNLVSSMITEGDFEHKDAQIKHFDIDALSDKQRAEYERRLSMMREIEEQYGPAFLGLCGNRSKPALEEIRKKYGMKTGTFRNLLNNYFRSGRMEYSLVDGRALKTKREEPYDYKKKTGRPPKHGDSEAVIRDEETIKILDDLVDRYLSSRSQSYQLVYDYMMATYFQREEVVNGKVRIAYAPPGEHPSFNQVKYYIQTHTGVKQRRVAKTSEGEYHNDERPLLGDATYGAKGPGDLVEIDAQEVDASLISLFREDQCVSRATVYIMIDVYSRAIVAVSIDFQQNSNQGLTNLFMCLGDDKHEFCRRYGMDFEGDLWPSNFIPARVRVDRGPEMKSEMVKDILIKAGINRQLVPPASGADKGVVEQIFHQMGAAINVHLEKKGLITKRHDCTAHKDAVLTINDYAQMVLMFVLTHNQLEMKGYRLTQEMRDAHVYKSPIKIWEYGVEKYGAPQPIVDRKQYLYNLMETPKGVKLTRYGIRYERHYYMPADDPGIVDDIRALNGKQRKYEIKADPRCIGAVYYRRGDRIVTAPLNPARTENMGVAGFTLKRWKEVRDDDAALDKIGQENNQPIRAYQFDVMESIVADAEKTTRNNTKDIRAARAMEKEVVAASSTIVERMDPGLVDDMIAGPSPAACLPGEVSDNTPEDVPEDTAEGTDAPRAPEGAASSPVADPDNGAAPPKKKSKYDMLESITDKVFGEMPEEEG